MFYGINLPLPSMMPDIVRGNSNYTKCYYLIDEEFPDADTSTTTFPFIPLSLSRS